MNEAVLQQSAMQCLVKNFGTVDAERFISIIIREKFDYTEWQKDLFVEMSVEELSKLAMEYKKSMRSIS